MWFRFHRVVFQLKKVFGLASDLEKIIQLPVFKPEVFAQAFNHGGGTLNSYERLEFLGDAVIESVISEFLYKKFPQASEGKLTQLRSRLVRRAALNLLGYRIGLGELIQSDFLAFDSLTDDNKRIFGDTLESLIGAIYINSGYAGAKFFLLDILIARYVNIADIDQATTNHKGALQELAQKLAFKIDYKLIETDKDKTKVKLLINKKTIATASSRTKKKAEQMAAKKALANKQELLSFVRQSQNNEQNLS